MNTVHINFFSGECDVLDLCTEVQNMFKKPSRELGEQQAFLLTHTFIFIVLHHVFGQLHLGYNNNG